MQTPIGTRALVRGVPRSFDRALGRKKSNEPIDVALAQRQHARYCETLERLGLQLIPIEPDDRYPDCSFVEDTALILEDKALIANMAAPTRRGETEAVKEVLRAYKQLHMIAAPATLDGGDVLQIGDTVYVGLSERTNERAVEQIRAILAPKAYRVVAVPVRNILHLKSACTHLGEGVIVHLPGHLDDRPFSAYRRITVPPEEAHAANCLSVNGLVLIAAGAPRTRKAIEAAGFETLELEMSEFVKASGGLTCSTIIFCPSPPRRASSRWGARA